MRPERRYQFVEEFVEPFDGHIAPALRAVIVALFSAGSGVIGHVAAKLVELTHVGGYGRFIQLKSARNRIWRLLRNERLLDMDLGKQLLKMAAKAVGRRHPIWLPVDWTEWHNGWKVLVCSVVLGNRSVPVLVQTYIKRKILRSQNTWENNFMRTMSAIVHELGIHATFLFDRGFRRVSFLKVLVSHGVDFVVRLKTDVHVRIADFPRTIGLANVPIRRGQIVDLGVVALRKTKPIRVRIVGVWDRRAKLPWWLATSLDTDPRDVVRAYYKRMAIEEQFRDIKGYRFGLGLKWTNFQRPEYLSRFYLLAAVATFGWLTAGQVALATNPKLAMPHPTKGPRYSPITLGQLCFAAVETIAPIHTATLRRYLPSPTLPPMHRMRQVRHPDHVPFRKALNAAFNAISRSKPIPTQEAHRDQKR